MRGPASAVECGAAVPQDPAPPSRHWTAPVIVDTDVQSGQHTDRGRPDHDRTRALRYYRYTLACISYNWEYAPPSRVSSA